MKIVLLNPPLKRTENTGELQKIAVGDDDSVKLPIGVLGLAAQLIELGHEVALLNHAVTPWSVSLAQAAAARPDLLGLTAMSRQRHGLGAWAAAFKKSLPGCPIVLGGVHGSFLYKEILERWGAVDYVAVGEADHSFPELVRRLAAGEAPGGIPGLAGRTADGGLDWPGPAAPVTDLGALPLAARYFASDIIATARGCPFSCTFCCSPGLWGSRVRERPIAHVIEELELLRRRHGFTQVHIKDETFTARKSRVLELCQAMIDARLNLWWTCDTRVDCLDEERLHWMRKAGCFYVSFGIESGSPAMLERIGKRTSPAKVREATALARRFGMLVRFYLITGLPGESARDLEATLDLTRACRPHFVFTAPLMLSPGTAVFEDYRARRGLDSAFWFDESLPANPYYDPAERWKAYPAARPLLALNNIGNRDNTPHHPFTEAELRAARERLADCFAPNYDLALFLKDHGRPAEAEPFYRAALELRPDFGKGWLDLGQCLDAQGRLDEAAACWERLDALEAEPENNRLLALLYRGLAEAAQGRLDAAVALWQRVHDAQPGVVDAVRLIAERCAQAGQWAQAAWGAERWLKLEPRSGPAYYIMGLACMVEGANDDALPMFENALRLCPKDPGVYFHAGVLLTRLGQPETARNLLQACLNLAPAHAEARELLGQLK